MGAKHMSLCYSGRGCSQLHASTALRVWANMWLAPAAERLWRTHSLLNMQVGLPVAVKLLTGQVLRQTHVEHSAYAGASMWGAAQDMIHLLSASTAASSTLTYSQPQRPTRTRLCL